MRMGSGKPKQFIEIGGKPIIIYTLELFENHSEIDDIYIACKSDYMDILNRMLKRFDITKVRQIVPGGKTGLDSIYRGLTAAREDGRSDDDVVLIHDGVRPCISSALITRIIEAVKKTDSGIPTLPLIETPIVSEDGKNINNVPSRKVCFTAQAPQGFKLGRIMEAHEAIRNNNPSYEGIVDCCTLLHSLGENTTMVRGDRGNIKVTTPEDLYIFRGMLLYQESQDAFGLNLREEEGL